MVGTIYNWNERTVVADKHLDFSNGMETKTRQKSKKLYYKND